jgi:hypothetical protein
LGAYVLLARRVEGKGGTGEEWVHKELGREVGGGRGAGEDGCGV